MKLPEVKVVKEEVRSIDGVDVDVQVVEIKGQRYTIGSLSMAQVEACLDPEKQKAGFARSWEVIADSMDEAVPAAERKPREEWLPNLKKRMRLAEHNALHGAVLRLSGLTTSGE